VIFTENGIYIFRYIGLFGYTKIFVKYHCLYATKEDALPFLKSRLNNFRFIHQIDLLQIEGRNATIEFGEYVSWTNMPFRQYRFVLLDVRGNDEYRNLIRFQRYRYDILENQKQKSMPPSQWDSKSFQKNSSESLQLPKKELDKEKIINGLSSAYKHERVWTIMQIWELDDINEQIMHTLKEMSATDPDPEVREAAKELIVAR
jgi:hypothetical protein